MAGPPPSVTPDEILEALAHDMPPDMRLAGRLPGDYYRTFHRTEMIWTHMLELGLISSAVYESVMGARLSFKFNLPAMAAPDYIKFVATSSNPAPLLALVSQSVGAKKLGDSTVPIRREDVMGMDPRTIQDLMQERLVRQELSLEGALAAAEIVISKQVEEGSLDDEDAKDLVRGARQFRQVIDRLLGPDAPRPRHPGPIKLPEPAPPAPAVSLEWRPTLQPGHAPAVVQARPFDLTVRLRQWGLQGTEASSLA